MDEIDWSDRLIALKGARGSGKTTLLLQHIKEEFDNSNKALYVAMDQVSLTKYRIIDVAKYFVNLGGTHLFIDEIHKYEDWSKEIKSIYDLYPSLHLVITGSSILHLYSSEADLSRRMVSYDLHGLSFREYLNIELNTNLPVFSLEDICKNHLNIASEITVQRTDILHYFKDYLQHGYYPFYLENKTTYALKLQNTINLTLDIDLPYIEGVNVQNIFKIKKLIHLLAVQVPFQPNISKLAASLELARNTLTQYLYYLENACVLHLLTDANKSYGYLTKPEKVYLHNTNLAFALTPRNVNKGTMRETFACNQLSAIHQVHISKKADFLVDEHYTFEIGGDNKSLKQIHDVENSYVLADDLLLGGNRKIPLWLMGFLY